MPLLLRPVSFKYQKVITPYLGEISRPVATVDFWSETFTEWQRYTMLIDTGADYTLLPRYMVGLLGLDVSKAKKVQSVGVGGAEFHLFVEKLKVRIGRHEREIIAGISNNNKIPLLMGRHLFFETFTVEFETNKRVTFK